MDAAKCLFPRNFLALGCLLVGFARASLPNQPPDFVKGEGFQALRRPLGYNSVVSPKRHATKF